VCRVIPIVFAFICCWAANSSIAEAQQASPSPARPNSAPTPIPLAKVPLEAESASNVLKEIEASLSGDQFAAAVASDSLVQLSSEIDAREADDNRLLAASPSLD